MATDDTDDDSTDADERPPVKAGDRLRAEAEGRVYEVEKVTESEVHIPEFSPVSKAKIEANIAAGRITRVTDEPSIEEYVAEHHGEEYDDPAAVLVIPDEEDLPVARGLLETAYHRIEPEYTAAPAEPTDSHDERLLREGSLYQELLGQLSEQEPDDSEA